MPCRNKSGHWLFTLFFIACILAALLLSGCITKPTANPQQTDGVFYTTVQTSGPADISQQTEKVYFFPVQKSNPLPGSASSLEFFKGRLIADDGYIRIVEFRTGESRLVIWPHGYSLDIAHHTPQILDDKGRLVAQVGDNVILDGGYGIDYDILDLRTGQTLTADIIKDKKPFWDASYVKFFPFWYVYTPYGPEDNQFDSTMEGTLVLVRGYIRFYTDSGASYLPVWPPAYELRKNEGQLVVAGRDTTGKFYIENIPGRVFIGDKVTIRGSEATTDTFKKYFMYSMPEEKEGPFWKVTGLKGSD